MSSMTTQNSPQHPTLLLFLLWLSGSNNNGGVHAWITCPNDRGGGTCPDDATCCATGIPGVSSCISEKEPNYAGVCCTDDGVGLTGCDHNYECIRTTTTATTTKTISSLSSSSFVPSTIMYSNNSNTDATALLLQQEKQQQQQQQQQHQVTAQQQDQLFCQRKQHPDDPNIPERLPRYQLCRVPRKEVRDLYGFTVDEANPDTTPVLAYHSNMNALDATDSYTLSRHATVRMAWIFIHGSKRNADDYLCCALAALPRTEQEQTFDTTTILVITPRFLDKSDGPVDIIVPSHHHHHHPNKTDNSTTTVQPLYYAKHGPIAHTWRYGADAVNANISSYAAIDAMVEALAFDTIRFPALQRIVVAGHSAGGQFVHRWALTSMSLAWGDDDDDDDDDNKNSNASTSSSSSPPVANRLVPIHAIAANPRSFCYLDGRRFDKNGTIFRLPNQRKIDHCPGYNQWEWGLDPGGPIHAPYKDRALQHVGGPMNMTVRYACRRNVTYLAGALDVVPIFSECEDDDFQGRNRRTRSEWFYKSLPLVLQQQQRPDTIHRRVVVPMVHHDHCLLFQSEQGRAVLFGQEGGGNVLEESEY